ncbi:ATP-binding cassette domain-containing protein, partial [Bacillus sp. SIMBA_005]|uniref:ATP-binding cassette domain-containing protein n=1 Tax=Bacillus sp. SIMBA_005 TaxID=3085754 RepID=UPI00397C8AFA
GKTTTLRMIAGFETPTAGDILIDGKSVLSVAPNKRPMSMVFQSYALFPHLTVQDNVGFGLTARHASKTVRKERVSAVMELMGIA